MALTPPAPVPVTSFSKGLIHWIEQTYIQPYVDLFQWVSKLGSAAEADWRYAVLVFQRGTPTGTVEDNAQIGVNITNITAGQLDATWTTQDFLDCETALAEWYAMLLNNMSSVATLKEIRWYHRKFNPDLPINMPVPQNDPATGKPYARFAHTGPPVRIKPIGTAGGAGTTPLPYQDAMSITLKTAVPKHWGRVYLPALSISVLDTLALGPGRFSAAVQTAIANQTAELIDDLAAKDFQVVIPTTQIDNRYQIALQTVSQVQVDDIPDVIRRRRARSPLRRTIGAPLP